MSLITANDGIHVIDLRSVGRTAKAAHAAISKSLAAVVGDGRCCGRFRVPLQGSALDEHIVAPHGLVNINHLNEFGSHRAVARRSLEACQWSNKFGTAVVGGLQAHEAGGNHVTILIGLALVAEDERIARVVHHIGTLAVVGKHGNRAGELHGFLVVGLVELGDVGHLDGSENLILGLGDVTALLALDGDGLDSGRCAHGNGGAISSRTCAGVAAVEGVEDVCALGVALQLHALSLIEGASSRSEDGLCHIVASRATHGDLDLSHTHLALRSGEDNFGGTANPSSHLVAYIVGSRLGNHQARTILRRAGGSGGDNNLRDSTNRRRNGHLLILKQAVLSGCKCTGSGLDGDAILRELFVARGAWTSSTNVLPLVGTSNKCDDGLCAQAQSHHAHDE